MADDGKRRWTGKGIGEGKNSAGRTAKKKVPARNAKTESSKRWIERQLADPYVKRTQADGYRSRAAYKLLEMDERAKILSPGQRVLDLGAAPGGWVQVVLEKGAKAVAGIDLLEIDPIPGAHLFVGDVADEAVVAQALDLLGGPPTLVLSDMAANTTGHRQTDHLRTVALVELAVEFALAHLSKGGHFCSKVFQGGATKDVLDTLKDNFRDVRHIKPPASRTHSPEIYVVAKSFKGR